MLKGEGKEPGKAIGVGVGGSEWKQHLGMKSPQWNPLLSLLV